MADLAGEQIPLERIKSDAQSLVYAMDRDLDVEAALEDLEDSIEAYRQMFPRGGQAS